MEGIKLSRPTLIFVGGGPTTGKTTLLKELVPLVRDAFLIDVDDIKDTFLSTPNRERWPGFQVEWYRLDGARQPSDGDFYRNHVGLHSYGTMLKQAETNLRLGKHPIAQGNYTGQINQGYFSKVVEPFFAASDIDPRIKLLFCYTDPSILPERIRERNAPRDAAKITSEEAMSKYIKSQDFRPAGLRDLDHVLLDSTTRSVGENVQIALDYLAVN